VVRKPTPGQWGEDDSRDSAWFKSAEEADASDVLLQDFCLDVWWFVNQKSCNPKCQYFAIQSWCSFTYA
jgi:hypothetical protein